MRVVICGIDAGTHVGIAILNLKGEVLLLTTLENPSASEVASLIIKYGTPLVIGSDVPNSLFVRKVSFLLRCKLIKPRKPLKVKWKEKKGRDLARNDNERDALSSAIYALDKIKRVAVKAIKEDSIHYDEILYRIIKGKSPNVKQAHRDINKNKF
ncbi:MAG: DUF460 domain-containing protein [Candidatus Parvarchaeota archaeon]|nr:DUF460 domain-containing protein [Candidatus Rehaiarchaeum fermentans]